MMISSFLWINLKSFLYIRYKDLSMIIGKNIHKYFGDVEVLKGVDLHIKKGEVVAVVGPSMT